MTLAFHCSASLLDHADQADEEVPPGVTLIHSASGQRKLRFQQNLLIRYSNNSLQVSDWISEMSVNRRKWILCDEVNLSLLCADGASPCLFGSYYNSSVHWQHRLWVLLRGADADHWSQPLQPWSPHLLEITHRLVLHSVLLHWLWGLFRSLFRHNLAILAGIMQYFWMAVVFFIYLTYHYFL